MEKLDLPNFKDNYDSFIDEFRDLDDIGVICRGPSLKHIDKIYDKFDHCFLVNRHEANARFLSPFLQEKKKIMAFGCSRKLLDRFQNLDKRALELLDVNNIMLLYTTPEIYKWNGYRDKIESYMNEYNFLDFHTIPKGYKVWKRRLYKKMLFPTSGNLVTSICSFLKPKRIHVIGMDFYANRTNYYIEGRDCFIDYTDKRPYKRVMDNVTKMISQETLDIEYNYYTYYEGLKPDYPENIKIHDLKKCS